MATARAIRAASRLSGVLGEDSAAQLHGWKMKNQPKSPCVVVRRKRNLTAAQRRGVRVRYVDLDRLDTIKAIAPQGNQRLVGGKIKPNIPLGV